MARMTLRTLCLLSLVLAVISGLSGEALARKSKLTPAKVKQIRKSNKSFNNCRKEAIGQLKQGTVSKKKFEVMLNTCKENFPGASLYTSCKKTAIRQARAKNVSAEKPIAACKRYLLAASFDPEAPVPFFVDKGQVYFAGIGMNRSVPVSSLNPP